MFSSASIKLLSSPTARRFLSSAPPPPRLFDYATIRQHLRPSKDAVDAIEKAFGMLAEGKVDVPIPMHIGIHETETAGPGDCHIKGGYILGATTWTVKLANVSFYKNLKKGLSPGSGIFIVCDATNGLPLAVFQENRYMTDLRTGAAGAVAVKHCASKDHKRVCFIGTGAIAQAMAEATHTVHRFDQGYVYGLDPKMSESFAKHVQSKLGYPVKVCATAEEAVRASDVVFTQTPANKVVLEEGWLKSHATIIASGSDQSTKNELPASVLKRGKYVCDLVRQCSKVGELRTALQQGVMTEKDVYAEIGEIVCGRKKGREGEEMIVVDLTGTGAQDAAIGQWAWNTLKNV
eukprot:gene24026-29073_t